MLRFASVVHIFVELKESQLLQEAMLRTGKKIFQASLAPMKKQPRKFSEMERVEHGKV